MVIRSRTSSAALSAASARTIWAAGPGGQHVVDLLAHLVVSAYPASGSRRNPLTGGAKSDDSMISSTGAGRTQTGAAVAGYGSEEGLRRYTARTSRYLHNCHRPRSRLPIIDG